MECVICCNEKSRATVTCPKCDLACCQGCFRRYLLELDGDAVCMNPECGHALSLDFIAGNTPKIFHNDQYRKHRTEIALSKERSLLPGTQHLAENQYKAVGIMEEIGQARKQEALLKQQLHEIKNHRHTLEIRHQRLSNIKEKEQVTKAQFIKACSVQNCRGFLSAAWKCGICQTYACSKCHEVKDGRDDENHVCKPENVATAKLLASSTKPCPKCAAPIHKVSGCSQMWCQHEDTPIWMWDGTKKRAKCIEIGDLIIGDDGTPRRVECLTKGETDLFEIEQSFGDNYKVIGNHLLTLRNGDKLVDISVNNYMALSNRDRIRGYHRVAVEAIQWPEQEVHLDPYILGMWLGDGMTRGDGFSTNDIPLLRRWIDWCSNNDLEVTHGRPFGYDIRNTNQGHRLPVGYESMETCTGCKKKSSVMCASVEELELLIEQEPDNVEYQEILEWRLSLPIRTNDLILGKSMKTNRFKVMLQECGVLNNKHIPLEYLCNSQAVRLEVLAGIIDTDGNKCNQAYRISQCIGRDALCDGIRDLCHSLGLATTRKTDNVIFPHGNKCNTQDQVYIRVIGDTTKIPLILEYKRIDSQGEYPASTIKVKSVGVGRFVGWEISGGSHRYLLGDGTVTHNCPLCHTVFNYHTGKLEKGIVHNPHYYEWQKKNREAPLAQDADPCGAGRNVPQARDMRIAAEMRSEKLFKGWEECHRSIHHFQNWVLPRYPAENGILDNTDLRVQFLINNISEKEWAAALQKRVKQREKNVEIRQVLEMYTATLGDLFHAYVKGPMDLEGQCNAIREYANDQFNKIAKRYGNKAPLINTKWFEAKKDDKI